MGLDNLPPPQCMLHCTSLSYRAEEDERDWKVICSVLEQTDTKKREKICRQFVQDCGCIWCPAILFSKKALWHLIKIKMRHWKTCCCSDFYYFFNSTAETLLRLSIANTFCYCKKKKKKTENLLQGNRVSCKQMKCTIILPRISTTCVQEVWIWMNTLISIISRCIKNLTTNSDADFTTSLKTLMYDCLLLPLKRESEAEQV